MNGYNRVIIMGTAGGDAELRTIEGGSTVANINIAVNETWTDKQNQKQENTEWFRVEAWNGLANFLGSWGKKGKSFLIEGKLKQESYEKDGVTKYSIKVVADRINFAEGNKGTNATNGQASAPAQNTVPQNTAPQNMAPQNTAPMQNAAPQNTAPAQNAAPAQNVAEQQTNNYVSNEQFMNDGNNDDLPF